jgi:hypothetical protein
VLDKLGDRWVLFFGVGSLAHYLRHFVRVDEGRPGLSACGQFKIN